MVFENTIQWYEWYSEWYILNNKAGYNYMYSLLDIKCLHRQPVDFPSI